MRKRAGMKRVFIAEIVRGKYFFADMAEKRAGYVLSPLGEKIIRASISGTVTEKFESDSFSSLTIDDGTEKIRVRSFREDAFSSVEIGDTVNCIGKVKEYGGEIYINVEVVRRINTQNEIFEKLKTLKRVFKRCKMIKEIRRIAQEFDEIFAIEYGKEKFNLDEETIQQILIPKEIDYSEKILDMIKSLDKGDGVDIQQIFSVSSLPEQIIESAISELLERGKLYEPKPGRFKCV
jgi:RPA family protein